MTLPADRIVRAVDTVGADIFARLVVEFEHGPLLLDDDELGRLGVIAVRAANIWAQTRWDRLHKEGWP